MAFILKIGETIDVHQVEIGSDQASMVFVGADEEAGKTYFALAILSPYEDGCPEYSFSILERDALTGTQRSMMSGLETAEIFSEMDRRYVLSAIFVATEALLKSVQPQKVYRCTHDVNPPNKALEKHSVITNIFYECGYRLVKSDIWYGKRVWWAELREAESD